MTVRQTAALVSLGLAAVAIAAFAPACRNGFVNYDDETYVLSNPHVREGLTRSNIRWAFTANQAASWNPLTWWPLQDYAANWHPLTWLSLQLDAELSGSPRTGQPPPAQLFHLTNVLVHAANTVLLYLVLLWMTGKAWPAALVSAFFAVHPLHVESVAWVAERKDVLSGLFWMLTLAAYLWYARRPGVGRYLLVALALALGLMAKPMLVTLPCVLLLLDIWPLGRLGPSQPPVPPRTGKRPTLAPRFAPASLRRLVVEKIPLLGLSLVSCVLTSVAQHHGEAMRSLQDVSLSLRLSNALIAYCGYLVKCFWPVDLACYYPLPQAGYPPGEVLLAAITLIGITIVVCRAWPKHPYLLVGWLWYLGTLVPVLGLVQVGRQSMADRYTYVPLVGIFLALVWGGAELAQRWHAPGLALKLAGGCVVVLGGLTWAQIGYWKNGVALWSHAVAVTTDNFIAHTNLAAALAQENQIAPAIEHLHRAIKINPEDSVALSNLGTILARERYDYAEAERLFRRALAVRPQDAVSHTHLALVLFYLNRMPEAEEQFRQALALEANTPGAVPDPLLRYNLARTLLRQALQDPTRLDRARIDEAIALLRQAISLRPHDASFHVALAYALQASGRPDAAMAEYQRAFRCDPYWPDRTNMEAWFLATCPDGRVRDGRLALEKALQINQASQYRHPGYLRTLAAARAEVGDFTQAIEVVKKAQGLPGGGGGLGASLAADLDHYQRKERPYLVQARPPAPPTPINP